MEKTQIKEVQRLDYIDMLKGIGIILVVVGHHLLEFERLTVWISSFHMPLFFIITGYLSGFKKEKFDDVKLVIINKAKSLMYPYVTFSLINLIWYLAFYYIFPIGGQPSETLQIVLLKTLTTFGYHAMWFLPAMFLSSILYYIIKKSKFSNFIYIAVLIAGCAVCVLIRQSGIDHDVIWHILNYLSRTAVATSFIYIGSLIYKLIIKLNDFTEWICIGICALFVIITLIINQIYMCRYNLAGSNIGNPFIFYISAISNSILLLLICKKINFKKGLLNFYGKNSLVIMATHMGFPVEIAWIIIGITKCPFSKLGNSIIAIIIEFIIMTICIVLINKYFKFLLRLPNKNKKNNSQKS